VTSRDRRHFEPIVVRAAVPADAASIVNVHFRAVHETARPFYSEQIVQRWSPPPNEARVARAMKGIVDEQEMLVAEIDEIICGFGSIVPNAEELRAVYVDPAFGRRGVGSAILQCLEELAVRRGVRRLSLDSSLNAEVFYAKHGYAVLERGTHRLSSGIEMACVKMTKQIPQDFISYP
jgi:putative acetyltransferase